MLVDNAGRQRVIDASLHLQMIRHAAIDAMAAGRCTPEVEVVVASPRRSDLGAWMMRESVGWRRLRSTRPAVTGAVLSQSLPNNRRICTDGLEMVSVFDFDSTDDAARELLAAEELGCYLFSFAPIQMRVVDDRAVYLEGPTQGATTSILRLTDHTALAAALRYWRAVADMGWRCTPRVPDLELTPRQRAIMELLKEGRTDDQVAAWLGLSVRTVRSAVHEVMVALQVESRFAAGYAYALLGRPPGVVAATCSTIAAPSAATTR